MADADKRSPEGSAPDPAPRGSLVVEPLATGIGENSRVFKEQSRLVGSEIVDSTIRDLTEEQLDPIREYLVRTVPMEILPATSRVADRQTIIVNAIEQAVKANPDLKIPESRATYEALFKRITGIGVLQQFLDDPQVTEVIVQDWDQVKIEKDGKLEPVGYSFTSPDDLYNTVRQFTALANQRIDTGSPMVDFSLPDGTRVNAVIGPVTNGETYLTVRRAKKQAFPLDQFVGVSMNQEMAEFLSWCRLAHLSMIFAGPTGSGKTTLMETLIGLVPDEEVVLCEEVPELKPRHPNLRRMKVPRTAGDEKSKNSRIDLNRIVRNALRMRPDVIIVGEVRGPEAEAMLIALTTGHRGGMTTLHANSAAEAAEKVATFAMMGDESAFTKLPGELLMRTIARAIDIVVVLHRDKASGRRYVWSIDELAGYDGRTLVVNNIFQARWMRDENGEMTVTWERNKDWMPCDKIWDRLNEASLRLGSTQGARLSEEQLQVYRKAILLNVNEQKWGQAAGYAREYLRYRENDRVIRDALELAEQEALRLGDGGQAEARPLAEDRPAMSSALIEEIRRTRAKPATSLIEQLADSKTPVVIERIIERGPAPEPPAAPAPTPVQAAVPAPGAPATVMAGRDIDPRRLGLISVTPAARLLDVSASTLRRLTDRGDIVPRMRTPDGGRWYLPADIEAYRQRSEQGAFPAPSAQPEPDMRPAADEHQAGAADPGDAPVPANEATPQEQVGESAPASEPTGDDDLIDGGDANAPGEMSAAVVQEDDADTNVPLGADGDAAETDLGMDLESAAPEVSTLPRDDADLGDDEPLLGDAGADEQVQELGEVRDEQETAPSAEGGTSVEEIWTTADAGEDGHEPEPEAALGGSEGGPEDSAAREDLADAATEDAYATDGSPATDDAASLRDAAEAVGDGTAPAEDAAVDPSVEMDSDVLPAIEEEGAWTDALPAVETGAENERPGDVGGPDALLETAADMPEVTGTGELDRTEPALDVRILDPDGEYTEMLRPLDGGPARDVTATGDEREDDSGSDAEDAAPARAVARESDDDRLWPRRRYTEEHAATAFDRSGAEWLGSEEESPVVDEAEEAWLPEPVSALPVPETVEQNAEETAPPATAGWRERVPTAHADDSAPRSGDTAPVPGWRMRGAARVPTASVPAWKRALRDIRGEGD